VQGESGSGYGVRGSSSSGVAGYFSTTSASPALEGVNFGAGPSILGFNSQGSGVGVQGESSTGSGVKGISASLNGVEGHSSGTGASGIYGENNGNGHGVAGRSYAPSGKLGSGVGVLGESGTGLGVKGASATGRGASFSGGAAAIQLIPSTASVHPKAGLAGDVFVDKTGRLWFCTKTGATATWKRVHLV
jgi:hypothetical protein